MVVVVLAVGTDDVVALAGRTVASRGWLLSAEGGHEIGVVEVTDAWLCDPHIWWPRPHATAAQVL
jgi:hypothetical protein